MGGCAKLTLLPTNIQRRAISEKFDCNISCVVRVCYDIKMTRNPFCLFAFITFISNHMLHAKLKNLSTDIMVQRRKLRNVGILNPIFL